MKKIALAFSILLMFLCTESYAENVVYNYEYATKIDSGLFSSIQKGYEIASKLTIDDVGKIATIVLANKNKKLDNVIDDITVYVNQIHKTNKDLRNIKFNKNTKIYIKRDK